MASIIESVVSKNRAKMKKAGDVVGYVFAFFCGTLFGVFLMALMVAARRGDDMEGN